MKNILYDKEDILPIILLALATTISNFCLYLFSTFSTGILIGVVYMHIFIIYRLKYLKYVPTTKIIKYAIYCLFFNTISCFLALYTVENGLRVVLGGVIDNFVQVGHKLAIVCILFLLLFNTLIKNVDKNKKTINRQYGKFAPLIVTIIFLLCNLMMFVLTKNLTDVFVGVIIVIPYVWYVASLSIKAENVGVNA